MRWVHEGKAYFSAGAPIRNVRHGKPHIAIYAGRWWCSPVGGFTKRILAAEFVVLRNNQENRPKVEI